MYLVHKEKCHSRECERWSTRVRPWKPETSSSSGPSDFRSHGNVWHGEKKHSTHIEKAGMEVLIFRRTMLKCFLRILKMFSSSKVSCHTIVLGGNDSYISLAPRPSTTHPEHWAELDREIQLIEFIMEAWESLCPNYGFVKESGRVETGLGRKRLSSEREERKLSKGENTVS